MKTHLDIVRQRLHNQRLATAKFDKPAEVVSWLGAVQAQDYLGALWAVGQRLRQGTEKDIEHALAEGTIIRTWPQRGTLHFVTPADIRWMLKLLTPRILAGNARRLLRDYELDEASIARCKELFQIALQGGKQLTRDELYRVLEAGRISTAKQRGLHILGWIAQEGVICFGARQGKQQTFVLLDEWAPPTRPLDRDEALAELTRRYFTSRGPATVQDFVWWSGLTVADAKIGLELVKSHLVREVLDEQTYWRSRTRTNVKGLIQDAQLLPVYDEYLVGYADRSAAFDARETKWANSNNAIFSPTIAIGGKVVGTWKRTITKGSVIVRPGFFTPLTKAENKAFNAAVKRYGAFLDLPAAIAGGSKAT